MRDSIGGVYLFNIVILFIILFTGIMCMTVNRTKAYSVKDAMIQEIELNDGLNLSGNIANIAEIARDFSYRTIGNCDTGYIGFDRDGNPDSSNSSICIRKVIINDPANVFDGYSDTSYLDDEAPSGCYYSVELFYSLGIPILKEVFGFSVQSETKTVYGENCK